MLEQVEILSLASFRRLCAKSAGEWRTWFHPLEREHFGDRQEHLAPRLAAKRALANLATKLPAGFGSLDQKRFEQMAVLRQKEARPRLYVGPKAQLDPRFFISLSCDRNYAGAYVLFWDEEIVCAC